ncbi:hypothetical protein CPB83DRAFT_765428 [Crepidotus variabilis]|uniref:Uncharacterized protein n=1 Tax=Crepidotus variabilis TaxID=179855 RepID=A0A9P6EGQ6_9AGAR|nr:hypothetical protein CPB83DRAFT_765428 [Crepidotus variabilis]
MFQRTFCCCIPVRAGVIFLGILGLFGGSGVTAIGIINLKNLGASKTSAIIQIIIYILLAIVSIFGLIGAISRRLGFVRLYFGMLIIHLIFSIATGIYAINRDFKDAPKYIQECASGSTEKSVHDGCLYAANLVKAVLISVFITAWILETWACVIVFKYSRQLADEDNAKTAVKDTESW